MKTANARFAIMTAMKASRSRFIDLRGLRLHVREWGPESAPRLYLLHGWMDASPSFQFIVDELKREWHLIAPDWRGFGLSAWSGVDSYWFPDYFADLDALLSVIEGNDETPVHLVGHSLGGNVALIYAGIRPQRVGGVVALDASGLQDMPVDEAPARYRRWLDQLRQPMQPNLYDSHDALAQRLMKDNPRLLPERAQWLARALGQAEAGGWRIAGDPAHRRVNPVLYRRGEAQACWRRVEAPVLYIEAGAGRLRQRLQISDQQHAAFLGSFADIRVCSLAEAGHNLHHEQPAEIARLIEEFFSPAEQGSE